MHEKKSEKHTGRTILIILIAVCIAAAAVFAVIHFAGGSAAEDEAKSPEEAEKGVEVKSPVGTLVYPEEWAEYLFTEEQTEENNYSAVFYSLRGDEKIRIFTIYTGDAGDGYLMGTAKDGSGKRVNVWIDAKEIQPAADWTDEEKDRIFEMQNRVNDIMDQIYNLKSFEKN